MKRAPSRRACSNPARRVLVADDEPLQRKLLCHRLVEAGFLTSGVSDGAELVAEARRDPPDVIVADVVMPVLDGLQACFRLRSDPQLRAIPVVLISSGEITQEDREVGDRAGAQAFIMRTPDCAAVIEAVRTALEAPVEAAEAAPEWDDLRRRFAEEGVEFLSTAPPAGEPELHDRLHRWAGAADILGLPQIGQVAREMEREVTPDGMEKLNEMFSDAVIDSLSNALSGRSLALVGFTVGDRAELNSALVQAGVSTVSMPIAAAAAAPEDFDCYDAVLVQASDTLPGGAAWLSALSAPVLLVGPMEALASIDHPTAECLVTPWREDELLLRLHRALRSTEAQPTVREIRQDEPSFSIVFADDDVKLGAAMSIMFRKYHIECHLARNGSEALRLTRRHRPDLVVLDVNMPMLNGFAALKTLKHDPITKDLPVVLVTGRKKREDVLLGCGLGAADYVIKPVSPLELVARLRKVLDSQQASDTS